MRTIVLTQKNIVNPANNVLVYQFPNSVAFRKNLVAISQVSIYYSWFNISTILGNNLFSYIFDGVQYDLVVPDGAYEIVDLNRFLQFSMIENGTYLVDGDGNNVYYAEMVISPTRYAVQVNTFLVPLALPAGYTAPANWVGFPANTFNPQLIFPENFSKIVGYAANFTTDLNLNNAAPNPTAAGGTKDVATGTISYLSSTSPNVQPNSSVLISMSNVDNKYATPTSIIYAIVPNVAVGQIINEKPPQFAWNRLVDGTYTELRLQLLGTDLQPIQINDPSITILLCIKDADERD